MTAPDQESIDKLRALVEEIDEQSEYWIDERPFWIATNEITVTAGDLRAWLVAVDGEPVES